MSAQPHRFRIVAAEQGMTLRQVLRRRIAELSARGRAAELIKAGGVYLDNVRVRLPTVRVVEGERITVYLTAIDDKPLDPASLQFLARGSDFIAVAKPAGISASASKASARGTISEAVVRVLRGEGFARPYVGVVYPLPPAIAGVLLMTIRDRQQRSILNLFRNQPGTRVFCVAGVHPSSEFEGRISPIPGNEAAEVEVAANVEPSAMVARLRATGSLATDDASVRVHCIGLRTQHPVTGQEISIAVDRPAWCQAQGSSSD